MTIMPLFATIGIELLVHNKPKRQENVIHTARKGKLQGSPSSTTVPIRCGWLEMGPLECSQPCSANTNASRISRHTYIPVLAVSRHMSTTLQGKISHYFKEAPLEYLTRLSEIFSGAITAPAHAAEKSSTGLHLEPTQQPPPLHSLIIAPQVTPQVLNVVPTVNSRPELPKILHFMGPSPVPLGIPTSRMIQRTPAPPKINISLQSTKIAKLMSPSGEQQ